MRSLRRLKRLEEARGFDESRHPPYSQQWFEFWGRQLERHLNGEHSLLLPLDAVRAWMRDPSLMTRIATDIEY